MKPLPLTVIGGYLGAGKTTLINRLLSDEHGLRLAVLVNDFGAINIDAALLKSASRDTIELTNGCVCCTMSGDLFFAVGDMLDRTPRPDHLIVEASGIADPARIANVALAEKELRYAGILTVVDGESFPDRMADGRISVQLRDQIRCADVVAVSKMSRQHPDTGAGLRAAGVTNWLCADEPGPIAALLFDPELPRGGLPPVSAVHPDYTTWSDTSPPVMTRSDLERKLSRIPSGLLRLKGLIPDPSGRLWEVHAVGRQTDIRERSDNQDAIGLVAIGLADEIAADAIRGWWMS